MKGPSQAEELPKQLEGPAQAPEASKGKAKRPRNPDEMTLFEHLDELRQRLVIAVIALVIGIVIGTMFTTPVLRWLVEPLGETGPVSLSPTETPSVFFKIATMIGLVLAMPVIMYEIFQYVRPGLVDKERRYVMLGAPAASLLFAGGVVFAGAVMLPASVSFLKGFLEEVIEPSYSIDRYVSFVLNILLWAGLVFETPLVMFLLSKLGVVKPQSYGKARRIVIVVAAIAAAILTPTVDPVSMLLLMAPLILLYEVGILLAKLSQRKPKDNPA